MTMPFDLISRSRMSSYRASASRPMRRMRFSKALLIAANVNVKSVNPTKRYLSLRDRRSRGQILLSCSHSPSPGACGPRTVKLYHLERRIPAQKRTSFLRSDAGTSSLRKGGRALLRSVDLNPIFDSQKPVRSSIVRVSAIADVEDQRLENRTVRLPESRCEAVPCVFPRSQT
jgi:hypothetical protein